MQDLHTLLKARLSMVRRSLTQVLDQLKDEDLDWALREGMRTVGGQLFEIVGKEIELLAYARAGGEAEWEEIETFGGRANTVAGYRQILEETRRATLDFLDSQSEADLHASVKFPGDWWEGLYLTELPMHEVVRSIAMHEWYHTGQLVSYLWFRGGEPE